MEIMKFDFNKKNRVEHTTLNMFRMKGISFARSLMQVDLTLHYVSWITNWKSFFTEAS